MHDSRTDGSKILCCGGGPPHRCVGHFQCVNFCRGADHVYSVRSRQMCNPDVCRRCDQACIALGMNARRKCTSSQRQSTKRSRATVKRQHSSASMDRTGALLAAAELTQQTLVHSRREHPSGGGKQQRLQRQHRLPCKSHRQTNMYWAHSRIMRQKSAQMRTQLLAAQQLVPPCPRSGAPCSTGW